MVSINATSLEVNSKIEQVSEGTPINYISNRLLPYSLRVTSLRVAEENGGYKLAAYPTEIREGDIPRATEESLSTNMYSKKHCDGKACSTKPL